MISMVQPEFVSDGIQRFCTHGKQQSRVAGIHIRLMKDKAVPMELEMLMMESVVCARVGARRVRTLADA